MSEKSSGRLSVLLRGHVWREQGKGKKEDSILLEFCCTLTLLEGISNWINNCLIPISQLDLSALTEEAVLWERDGRRV